MGAQKKTHATPRLVIIEGKEKGKVIPLKNGTAIIGRTKGDVLIHDPRISRSHISILFDEETGHLSFSDLKSLNGSFLNGHPSTASELHDGDRLQIGNTVFDCQLQSQDSVRPPDHTMANSFKNKEPRITFESVSNAEPRKDRTGSRKRDREKTPSSTGESPPTSQSLFAPYLKKAKILWDNWAKKTSNEKAENSPSRNQTSLGPRIPVLPPVVKLAGVAGLTILIAVMFMPASTEFSQKELEADIEAVQKLEKELKYAEATSKLDELKKKYPENSEVYLLVADHFLNQNQLEPAIQALEKAKIYNPPLPNVHIRLLQIYLKQKNEAGIQNEVRAVEKTLAAGKPTKTFAMELATLYQDHRELKDLRAAMLPLSRQIQMEFAPNSSLGHKIEAGIYMQENKNVEAAKVLENALKIDPSDEWILENLTFTKISQSDRAGAELILEEWVKLKSSATKPLLILGYLYYKDKEFKRALPYVQKVLQLGAANPADPQYPEALDLMGQLYLANQQTPEAINFFKQGCEAGFQQSCENPLLRSLSQTVSPPVPDPNNPPPIQNVPKGEIQEDPVPAPPAPPTAEGRQPDSGTPPGPPATSPVEEGIEQLPTN